VLISNPNREAATVDVRFLLPGGVHIDKTYKIAAQTRYTIPVDKIKGSRPPRSRRPSAATCR